MKFRVWGKVELPVYIDVEAENAEAAMEEADERWPGLSEYAGNGRRHGGLMGPSDPLTNNASIEAPEDPIQWDKVEERK